LLGLAVGVGLSLWATKGAAQVCGDGLKEASEMCDDGNPVSGDGCGTVCGVEPGWSCSCEAPFFMYSNEQFAGRVGGTGGGVGPQMGCTGNDVLIGLAIQWSDGRNDATRTRAICGSVSVTPTGEVATARTTSQESGGSGCAGWDPSTWSPDVLCPSGWIIVGLRGENAPGTLFYSISIMCQQMGVDGFPAGLAQEVAVPGSTLGIGTAVSVDCPSGGIARWFQTRSGCGQDALDLYCGEATAGCGSATSICNTQCGDGAIGAPVEQCDDGNAIRGDGCSASCQVESGWSCGSVPCAPICGDGMTIGGEACDDSNTANGDGCSADCTIEPGWTCNMGECTAVCGDRMIVGRESCDDGSTTPGDGCSDTCTIEAGWNCGCAAPDFSYTGEHLAGRLGGEGGDEGPPMGCEDNEVLIGLAIEWSALRGEAVRTRAICGSFSVDASGMVSTERTRSEESGGSGCSGWAPAEWSPEAICPTGWAVVGLRGLLSDAGTHFERARIVCQQMAPDGSLIGPTNELDITGGGGMGTPQEVNCPAGTIARWFQTRADCGQESLNLHCGSPEILCDEQPSVCTTAYNCGNGVVDVGEGCDGGSANSNTMANACRTNCQPPSCGDGVLDVGEGCDEGAANSGEPGASCHMNCARPTCGDGIVDPDEQCDDGDDNSDTSDACRTRCVLPSCGDNIVDMGEACDEGPTGSATCTPGCMQLSPTTDGGVRPDTGVADGGLGPDAGIEDFNLAGGACSCSVPGGSGRGTGALFLVALIALAVFARRRS
jgi:MYXO-CTERM domain-containing protein